MAVDQFPNKALTVGEIKKLIGDFPDDFVLTVDMVAEDEEGNTWMPDDVEHTTYVVGVSIMGNLICRTKRD